MSVRVLNIDTLDTSEEKIDSKLLKGKMYPNSIPVVLKWHSCNKRSGTASTKQMSEISGTTAKPFRQKGTGNARQGSKRSVQFVGGRTCFGPVVRDYSYSLPKQLIKKVLRTVLVEKIQDKKVFIIDSLDSLKLNTKNLKQKLTSAKIDNALFVYSDEKDASNFIKSLKNIIHFNCLSANGMNAYDIIKHEFLLLDRKAFEKVKEVLQ